MIHIKYARRGHVPGLSTRHVPSSLSHQLFRNILGQQPTRWGCGGIMRGERRLSPRPKHTSNPPKQALIPASPSWPMAGMDAPHLSPLPLENGEGGLPSCPTRYGGGRTWRRFEGHLA